MILLAAGVCGRCFLPAGFQLAPRDEGVGIDFQPSQGAAADVGAEDFSQKFDFLEKRTVAEIFRINLVNEKRKIFRQNQGQHPDVARILAVALIQTEKTVAFAAKELDGIDHFDIAIVDDSFEQTGEIPEWDPIRCGHQINDAQWIRLQGEDSELAVRRRGAFLEFSTR